MFPPHAFQPVRPLSTRTKQLPSDDNPIFTVFGIEKTSAIDILDWENECRLRHDPEIFGSSSSNRGGWLLLVDYSSEL
jgi:hypothetical protein